MDAGKNLRSVSISWTDPMALAEAGRAMPGIEFLRAIREVADLPPGWTAWRSAPGQPWQRGLWQSGEGPID